MMSSHKWEVQALSYQIHSWLAQAQHNVSSPHPSSQDTKWSNFSACHGFATRLIHGRTTLCVTGYQEFSGTVSVWITKNTGCAGNYWIEDRMLDRRRLYSLVCNPPCGPCTGCLLITALQAVTRAHGLYLAPPGRCTLLSSSWHSAAPRQGPWHGPASSPSSLYNFITLFQGIIENLTRRVVGFKRTRKLFILINWIEEQ